MEKVKNKVPVIHSHLLPSISHGFFTREGGVSSGVFNSLNCGKKDKDNEKNVEKNREIVKRTMGLSTLPLLLVRQVHGNKVAVVTKPWDLINSPEADAMVTQNPNCILGVLTADCIPVLLHDPVSKTVGVAHSGWRGAFAGVIQNTIKEMKKLGAEPKNILAVLGPCITQQSYEVGLDFHKDFIKKDPGFEKYFEEQSSPKGLYFDLPHFVEDQLILTGIKEIERLAYDTYDNTDLFFSCRRATHLKEDDFGVQISTISLQPGSHKCHK
jgi:YfiH family protein